MAQLITYFLVLFDKLLKDAWPKDTNTTKPNWSKKNRVDPRQHTCPLVEIKANFYMLNGGYFFFKPRRRNYRKASFLI